MLQRFGDQRGIAQITAHRHFGHTDLISNVLKPRSFFLDLRHDGSYQEWEESTKKRAGLVCLSVGPPPEAGRSPLLMAPPGIIPAVNQIPKFRYPARPAASTRFHPRPPAHRWCQPVGR